MNIKICRVARKAGWKIFEGRTNIMKKTYKIEVDCANCANKMEEAAKKTEGVKDAVVNFMALKMIVEFADGADVKSVMENVLKNCKKVEDDCEIFI
jgi:cation transport ATPase